MSKKPQVNGSGLGMDTLLTTHGKALQSGQEVRFVLVKGPSSSRTLSADPVNEKAPKEAFPLVAKFPESVVTPDFTNKPWNAARFYQRDTPKAQDDSDEEGQAQTQPKKRWRARNQEVKRQWVLQEEVEFLETMMAKRQGGGGTDDNASKKQLTSRVYEGVPERNSSQFVLLEANANIDNNIRVTILPTPNETIRFRQPKAVKTLSMSEAEQALDDQRNKTSRFMMHDQQRIFQGQAPIHRSRTRLLGKLMADNNNNNGDEDNDLDKGSGKKRAYKRKRLDGGNDEDDVMGDLSFRNTKGSAKARQELLNSFGNDMRVDADGVLGGANDAVFGQRGQRFGHFSMTKEQKAANKSSTTAAKTGHDGNAMADDFYQRDVQAEYEELDYDANEQFDDDDVDVGETDVVMGDSNFGGIDDDEENDEDLEEGMHGETPTGAEGLASLAGFRLMLAKAKMTPEQLKELAEMNKRQAEEEDLLAENNKNNNSNNDDKNKKKEETETDHLAKIMEAAEKARLEAESKEAAQNAAENAHLEADESKPNANNSNNNNNNNNNNININNNINNISKKVQVDENGLRLVTLDALRHEIWLARGRIPMKRLTKIFSVNKKSSKDRQAKFKQVVRELCTMEQDP
eukprot:CAMPEP_0116126612 /NCGR_PEP_ID=MMETSP0329-20121206/6421_1 /TAXON_ID=697910 /ORGANISM="Pseudo-nitzschia arenysensis, Strain B593" /LENGTH=629 /DNA_ID=CAMNT_0003620699 /DNA_START=199 /DNA_END=2085 /DNA_ORIENTATION=+